MAGAIAFFLGIPQPFAHKASTKSHVKLLTLSKEDYEDIKDRYPESRDRLIDNIKAQVGLGREGELIDDLRLMHQPRSCTVSRHHINTNR